MVLFNHFRAPMVRGHGFDGGFWPVFGGLVPVLLFLILVGVVIWAVLRFTSANRAAPVTAGAPALPRRDAALEEARLRYARGEMSREEYWEVARDLGGEVPEPGEPPPSKGK